MLLVIPCSPPSMMPRPLVGTAQCATLRSSIRPRVAHCRTLPTRAPCVCSAAASTNTATVDAPPLPYTFELPAGSVEVRQMLDEDEAGAVVVLTRAFATQPGALPIKDVSYVLQ